jgi:DNA-binding LytR/AlgR family response regulator
MMFTDMVLPGGMTGRDLAMEARRLMPELPILFSSGYSRNVLDEGEAGGSEIQLLAKPYRLDELATSVREMLDR